MNVIVTSDRFFEDLPGGSYRVALETARLLRDAGHRVALLCGSLQAPPVTSQRFEEIRLVRYRLPRSVPGPLRWPSRLAAVRAAYRVALDDLRWDLLHAHSAAEPLALLPRLGGVRFVYTAHSPLVDEQIVNWAGPGLGLALRRALGLPALRRMERRFLERAQVVHVLSTFTLERLRAYHGAEAMRRALVLPWWPDPPASPLPSTAEARRRLGLPEDGPLLLSLRRLVRRMGLSDLLEALEPLAAVHPFHLVVVGDGPERAALEARTAAGPLAGRVCFTGRLDDEQVGLAYAAADLLAVPSRALECFGLIVLEAASRGCPVVSSDAGALPEVAGRLFPGWTHPAGDPSALRQILAGWLSGARPLPGRAAVAARCAEAYPPAGLRARYLGMIEGVGARPDGW